MDVIGVEPDSDTATDLHAEPQYIHIKEMFVISDVKGGDELLGTKLDWQPFLVADHDVKVEPKEEVLVIKEEVMDEIILEEDGIKPRDVFDLCSEKLVKEEESTADGSELASPLHLVNPSLPNAQGCGTFINSKFDGYLKDELLPGNAVSHDEFSCNLEPVENSECKAEVFGSDLSEYVQTYSNKPVKMDPIVKLTRLDLPRLGLEHLDISKNETGTCKLRGHKSALETEVVKDVRATGVVKTVGHFPTRQAIRRHSSCFNFTSGSKCKINIFSEQINECTTQKNVNVDCVLTLSEKSSSELEIKQCLSGFSSTKILAEESNTSESLTHKCRMVQCPEIWSSSYKLMPHVGNCNTTRNAEKKNARKSLGSRRRLETDKDESACVTGIVKGNKRLPSNYKVKQCLSDDNTIMNKKQKEDICKSETRTDKNKIVVGNMLKHSKRLSSKYKVTQCIRDSNSEKGMEVKRGILRAEVNVQAVQKKTARRLQSSAQTDHKIAVNIRRGTHNIQKKIVKADSTLKLSKELSSKQELMQHSRAHLDDTPYHCDKCNKQYATSHGLQDHYVFHTGSRPFVCKVCAKMFSSLIQLVKHYQIHRRDKAYECQLCYKKFRFLISLKTHILFHTGERPFECILCNKRFFTSLDLKNHIHIHTGEKPYVCKLCWKGFSSAASLRKHRFYHSRGRPYTCKFCGKQFERYKLLTRHVQKHKVIKYECGECREVFSSLDIIKKHALTHCSVQSCPLCNSRFSNPTSLMCHYRSHVRFNHFIKLEEGTDTLLPCQ